MRTGTEPGDFVEFDLDLIEAERRRRLRQALEAARPHLEREIKTDLRVDTDTGPLVLSDAKGPRFAGTIAPDGRLMITDLRGYEVL